jgi:hypothetical protein
VFSQAQLEMVSRFVRSFTSFWQLNIDVKAPSTAANPAKIKRLRFNLNAFKQVFDFFLSLGFPHF